MDVAAVLVPFDGSPAASRALRHAMTLGASIHLVNVQAKADSPALLLHRTVDEIDHHQREYCAAQLANARKMLDEARVPYTQHVRIGEPAEEIARLCTSESIDQIVMGTRGMGAIGNWVLGSTATKVIHLANVPVTLVK
jgi:nucleotide-binding universal stress UspA family protein